MTIPFVLSHAMTSFTLVLGIINFLLNSFPLPNFWGLTNINSVAGKLSHTFVRITLTYPYVFICILDPL